MKNFIILIAVFGLFISPAIAQTDANLRYHEFGINFSSLNNFGLRYKFGNEKTMLRVSLLAVNLQSSNKQGQESDSSKIKQTGYGAGLRIGFDHKIPLFSTFNLLLGAKFCRELLIPASAYRVCRRYSDRYYYLRYFTGNLFHFRRKLYFERSPGTWSGDQSDLIVYL